MRYLNKLIPYNTVREGVLKWLKKNLSYNNRFPYNCGYCIQKGSNSGDCWCTFPKTLVWSYFSGVPMWENDTPGAYYYLDARYNANRQIINQKESSGMPDWDGASIINGFCEAVSFKNLASAKMCLLLNGDATHMGMYIGDFQLSDGYTYNTAEMTPNGYISPRMASYVDENGYCYNHKGGQYVRAWAKAGKMTGIIDFTGSDVAPSKPTTKPWSIDNVAVYIMRGSIPDGTKIPNGMDNRKTFFAQFGYTGAEVQQAQDIVNKVYEKHEIDKLACDLAMKFISGECGDGVTKRREWIANNYPNYDTETLFRKTQDKVNDYLG